MGALAALRWLGPLAAGLLLGLLLGPLAAGLLPGPLAPVLHAAEPAGVPGADERRELAWIESLYQAGDDYRAETEILRMTGRTPAPAAAPGQRGDSATIIQP